MARGTIRYWAAARAAAGVAEDPYDGDTLADALAQARALRGEALAKVLDRCSYVVDDAPVGGRAHDSVRLTDGGTVECLPPFAGGSGTAQSPNDHGLPARRTRPGMANSP
jgi:sulfur-carrier protein